MNQDPSDATPIHQARRQVRRFTEGVLRCDEEVQPVRFIIDGRDASIVFPAELEQPQGAVLYIPNDGFDEMALLLDTENFDTAFDEAKDRHQAYHGHPDLVDWFRARIDSAKWQNRVFEGAEVLSPNTLRPCEPALVRTLNADRDRLAEVTRLLTGVKPEQAVCVGVDPIGMDVRTRVGVIRVEWPREIEYPDQAPRVIEALLSDGLSAPSERDTSREQDDGPANR